MKMASDDKVKKKKRGRERRRKRENAQQTREMNIKETKVKENKIVKEKKQSRSAEAWANNDGNIAVLMMMVMTTIVKLIDIGDDVQ